MRTSPDILLRALESDDAPVIHQWRSDPAMRDGALGHPVPASLQAEREWIARFTVQGFPSDICLGICGSNDATLLGYVQLRGIDWIAKTAEVGIVIGSSADRGTGVGSAALARLLDYATDVLGLRRLWLRVAEFNVAALKLYEKAGFSVEGRLRRHTFRQGEYHDVVLMGWEPGRPSTG